ncbi:hypothetical protein PPERSA_06672 [Pseudocohnilembus persalinus]|uniref:Histidine phosphatase superfamily, clade-1 n=1 Tax=Pseudocohnilembus persalinus TaxID=266149 RepID=A0A0V0QRT2_PSEPJ|nr:hypothetical protein PPERSA_06672 [Pseudocohnilembus persalinus]|eukprot:KRX05038.1 hypothetical protein PPERSA_06672 [Pseudocohnilembus persalinus]
MELLGKHIGEFVKLSGKNFLFVRHGECMANYSGVLAGFLDSRLTVKGREQAHSLYQHIYPHINSFNNIYCSDLQRAIDTAEISLGFPEQKIIQQKPILREINFGKEENLHFDSLPDDRKQLINSIDFQSEGGESWHDVRKRVIKFMSQQPDGNHLVYSHGGLMCSLTWYIGLQDTVPNCSAIGMQVDSEGVPQKLHFVWEYPETEEL